MHASLIFFNRSLAFRTRLWISQYPENINKKFASQQRGSHLNYLKVNRNETISRHITQPYFTTSTKGWIYNLEHHYATKRTSIKLYFICMDHWKPWCSTWFFLIVEEAKICNDVLAQIMYRAQLSVHGLVYLATPFLKIWCVCVCVGVRGLGGSNWGITKTSA